MTTERTRHPRLSSSRDRPKGFMPWSESPVLCKYLEQTEDAEVIKTTECTITAVVRVTVRNNGMIFDVPLCSVHQRIFNSQKASQRKRRQQTPGNLDSSPIQN
jgi:hypothetical protein